MNTVEQVTEVVRAGGEHIPELLERIEQRLGELAADHGDVLAEHAGATIAAGGKRLRPLLVCLAADGEDGDGVVRAAAAVELVHSATLVHDDVLDGASLRRGMPTVVASGGRGAATATGDLLFARAFGELVRNGSPDEVRVLSDATSALAAGELMQRADAWDATVPVARYLRRCELKTARLFEAACRLGAIEAGAERRRAWASSAGASASPSSSSTTCSTSPGPAERTGKHRGTDLLDGTVTLPLILARERDGELAALDQRTIDSPAAAEAVCDRIEATGALDEARARALRMVGEAKDGLPAGLSGRQRHALDLVADGVVARYA